MGRGLRSALLPIPNYEVSSRGGLRGTFFLGRTTNKLGTRLAVRLRAFRAANIIRLGDPLRPRIARYLNASATDRPLADRRCHARFGRSDCPKRRRRTRAE